MIRMSDGPVLSSADIIRPPRHPNGVVSPNGNGGVATRIKNHVTPVYRITAMRQSAYCKYCEIGTILRLYELTFH